MQSAVHEQGGVWWTAFWGSPEVEDVDRVIGAWEGALVRGVPYRSLVDVREVRRVDPIAFGRLCERLRAHQRGFARLLVRQAVVRPDGVVGAIASGVLGLLEWASPLGGFADPDAALAWLGAAGDAGKYAAWLEQVSGPSPVLRRVRELLADEPELDVAQAAQRLATSPRTLQRRLREAGSGFAEERARARVERAKELLVATDAKIATIARRVGYRDEERFTARFVRAAGETPSAWRAARR
jgi:AraC-like DNA-binding protein